MTGTVRDCDRKPHEHKPRPAKRPKLEHDRSRPADLLAEVEWRFAEAAMTLARLPGHVLPLDFGDQVSAEDRDDEDLPHPGRPTAAQISRMDEVFGWVAYLPKLPDSYRILVLKRLVRSARTGKYRYGWSRLGRMLGVSNHTAKHWHAQAMHLVAMKITAPPG